MRQKPVVWLGDALEAMTAFPADARRVCAPRLREASATDTEKRDRLGEESLSRAHRSAEGGALAQGALDMKMTRSSGNVFRDLGFPPGEAEHLKIRAELMLRLQRVVTARGLKQGETARLLGVTQPRVSDLMRGRIDLFSTDALIDMLARLGMRTKVVLVPPRRRAGAA